MNLTLHSFRLPHSAFGLAVAAAIAATTASAADWFVAKDGDDANSGATRAEAKASVAAGYYCLTNNPAATAGDRLVFGEGEWTSDDFGSTLMLSNGWTVVGEHGRGATTFKAVVNSFVFFSFGSEDSGVFGVKFDFNSKSYTVAAFSMPCGKIEDCDIVNIKNTSYGTQPAIVAFSGSGFKTLRNCVFRNCSLVCNSAVVYALDQSAKNFLIDGCQFIDCTSGTANSYGGAAIVHGFRAVGTIRNCLFLRNVVYGASTAYAAGGIVSCNDFGADFIVENCTFAENKIGRNDVAGVVGNRSASSLPGTIAIRNCLAWGNSNRSGPVGIVTKVGTVENCASDVETTVGTGNVLLTAANTTFREMREGRFIPLSGPAIDGALTLPWMADSTDLLGGSRVVGAAPDIGCFENSGVEPRTYYVAKDGDDANSGLSRAEAKATIAAGYALLSGYDETLVVGDGVWTDDPGETLVLSNGWTIVGEHGASHTTLRTTSTVRLFDLASRGAAVRGLTIDFGNLNYGNVASGLVYNPQGVFADCVVSNFLSAGGMVDAKLAGSQPVFTNCLFRNCVSTYYHAVFWLEGAVQACLTDCSFVDCSGHARGSSPGFGWGVIYFANSPSILRNSLVLRCSAYGRYLTTASYASVVNCGPRSGATIENCSFIDCAVLGGSEGGALAMTEPLSAGTGGGTAVNCFAYGTTNANGRANLLGGLSYSHCASDSELSGQGNVVLNDGNFRYRRAAKGDYTVSRGPTLNAGAVLPWMADANDILGRKRILGPAPDIGCYEYDYLTATRISLR